MNNDGEYTPPRWLLDHAVIKDRPVHLNGCVPAKPYVVFLTNHRLHPGPQWAVKVLPADSRETEIQAKLLQLCRSCPNHTMPFEAHRTPEGRAYMLMPQLNAVHTIWKDLATLLNYYSQLLEGLVFMHSVHIAHMDISSTNCVIASGQSAQDHPDIEEEKIYYIDFGSSKHLDLGPGRQPAIELGPAQYLQMSRLGTRVFDPYAWDVYCLSIAFQGLSRSLYQNNAQPWLLRRYLQWMRGDEPDRCTGVCRCRPTARRAQQVFYVVSFLLKLREAVGSALVRACGWISRSSPPRNE